MILAIVLFVCVCFFILAIAFFVPSQGGARDRTEERRIAEVTDRAFAEWNTRKMEDAMAERERQEKAPSREAVMIDYPGILRQMGDRPPDSAIDLTGMLPMETFQAIGDRLRAEGKLRPFRDIALLYDEQGAPLGKVERQSDQTWAGAIIFQGTWYPVHRDADGAPLIVENGDTDALS